MKRILLPLFLVAAPAHATGDAQLWAVVEASGPIAGSWRGSVNIQARAGSARQLRQAFYGFELAHALGKRVTVAGAYTLVLSRDTRGLGTEHRLQQEATFDLIDRPDLRLETRTRFEQRFFESGAPSRYRLRQQVRAARPVSPGLAILVSTEAFSILNNPDRDDVGIDRWRHFIGVEVRLSERFSLESGYIHQQNHRRGEDEINRIASLSLLTRW